MACGCPTVVTDSGGINQFARNNENCLIIPVKDQPKLVDAMQKLLLSPSLSGELAINGLETAAFFDWESATDRFEKSLLSILDKSLRY